MGAAATFRSSRSGGCNEVAAGSSSTGGKRPFRVRLGSDVTLRSCRPAIPRGMAGSRHWVGFVRPQGAPCSRPNAITLASSVTTISQPVISVIVIGYRPIIISRSIPLPISLIFFRIAELPDYVSPSLFVSSLIAFLICELSILKDTFFRTFSAISSSLRR